MKKKQEKTTDINLIESKKFVQLGFTKGLWKHRRSDIDHIMKGFDNLINIS
jgi:hypothetical protein